MKLLKGRLVLTAVLFVGWLGYLWYLVETRPLTATGVPLVLSRPQIMTSRIDIIADVSDTKGEVVVEQVLFQPRGLGDGRLQKGDKIEILDLDRCRPLPRRQNEKTPDDFTSPGQYLIPLRKSKRKEGAYEVVPIPTSPGFNAKGMDDDGKRPVRIYPYTKEAEEQYFQIEKPTAP